MDSIKRAHGDLPVVVNFLLCMDSLLMVIKLERVTIEGLFSQLTVIIEFRENHKGDLSLQFFC